MSGRTEVRGVVVIVAAGACYASATIAAKFAYRHGAASATVISIRFAGAAVVLAILARLTGAPWRPERGRLRRLAVMGAISAVVGLLFFGSLQRIPASTATLLLYAHPAIVAAAAFLMRRDSPRPATVAALVLALGGVALVIGAPSGHLDPAGVAMALGGAVALAVFVLAARRAVAGAHPLVASGSVLAGAALAYGVPAAALGALRAPPAGEAWGWMVGVALFTAAAVTLFLAAVDRLGPVRASIGATVEPLFTVVLGVALLDESLSAWQAVGGLLVVAAVVTLPAVELGVRRPGARAGRFAASRE